MKRAIATGIEMQLALQGEDPAGVTALCAMMELPAGDVPEWVHLLPPGPRIETHDGRGPYTLDDPAGVVTRSLQASTDRGSVLDENHSTDKAAPLGLPSPASGWFSGFEAREDGIWGKVDWNAHGRQLVADKRYRGISPAIIHDKAGRILAITRASLINRPNLKGLETLHMESDMDLLAQLIKKLGLAESTSQEALVAAVEALHGQQTALQSIATAAGLGDGATSEAIIGAIGDLKKAPAGGKTVEALQGELNTVTTELNSLKEGTARDKATAFVDRAIADKVVGVSARRDEFIAMHMENPKSAEHLIAGFPKLGRSGTDIVPPKRDSATGELEPEQLRAAALLGIDPKKYAETLAAEGRVEAAA